MHPWVLTWLQGGWVPVPWGGRHLLTTVIQQIYYSIWYSVWFLWWQKCHERMIRPMEVYLQTAKANAKAKIFFDLCSYSMWQRSAFPKNQFFKKIYGGYKFLWDHWSPVLDFGDICLGFQSQGGFLYLHNSSLACNWFLRFTSGVTPADLLAVSMAAKPFHPHTCICTLVGLGARIKCAAASHACDKTDALPTELSRLSYLEAALFSRSVSLSVNVPLVIH